MPGEAVMSAFGCCRCVCGLDRIGYNLCDPDYREVFAGTTWTGWKKSICGVRRRQGEASVRRAKQREERKKQDQEETKTSEKRSDHKVSGVSFATTLQAQETETLEGSAVKKRKKTSSQKAPDLRELTVPEEMGASEALPSPFEAFVINRPENEQTTAEPEYAEGQVWEESAEIPKEEPIQQQSAVKKKTKASAAAVERRPSR